MEGATPLRAAQNLFEREVAHCSDRLNAFEPPDEAEIVRLGHSCSLLGDTSRLVVQMMYYRLGEGASVYRNYTLNRCLRDVQVAEQHAAIGPKHYDAAARRHARNAD